MRSILLQYCLFYYILDIDECKENTDDCDVNADCNNTPGSFTCTCKDGYTGNGRKCKGTYFLEDVPLNLICN